MKPIESDSIQKSRLLFFFPRKGQAFGRWSSKERYIHTQSFPLSLSLSLSQTSRLSKKKRTKGKKECGVYYVAFWVLSFRTKKIDTKKDKREKRETNLGYRIKKKEERGFPFKRFFFVG